MLLLLCVVLLIGDFFCLVFFVISCVLGTENQFRSIPSSDKAQRPRFKCSVSMFCNLTLKFVVSVLGWSDCYIKTIYRVIFWGGLDLSKLHGIWTFHSLI